MTGPSPNTITPGKTASLKEKEMHDIARRSIVEMQEGNKAAKVQVQSNLDSFKKAAKDDVISYARSKYAEDPPFSSMSTLLSSDKDLQKKWDATKEGMKKYGQAVTDSYNAGMHARYRAWLDTWEHVVAPMMGEVEPGETFLEWLLRAENEFARLVRKAREEREWAESAEQLGRIVAKIMAAKEKCERGLGQAE